MSRTKIHWPTPGDRWSDDAIAGLIGQRVGVTAEGADPVMTTVVDARRTEGGIDLTLEGPETLVALPPISVSRPSLGRARRFDLTPRKRR